VGIVHEASDSRPAIFRPPSSEWEEADLQRI
jgi:hypothetical protein